MSIEFKHRRYLFFVRSSVNILSRVEIEHASLSSAQQIAESLDDIRISNLIDEREFDHLKEIVAAL